MKDRTLVGRLYADSIVDTIREPLLLLTDDLHIAMADTSFCKASNLPRENIEGRYLYNVSDGEWNLPELRRVLATDDEAGVMKHDASAGRVLVVDDEPANVSLLRRVMEHEGYDVVSASNGGLALEAVVRERPDVVLMDVNMPEVNGFQACLQLKRAPETRLLPVILITGLTATEDRIRGIEAGADDFLSKPFVVDELRARVRSLRRMKRYTDELESAESVILSLALTIEARDAATKGHCDRLARYAVMLGERLGLSDSQLRALHLGGFLHDVGKVGVPDAVLLKPGPLSGAEIVQMQQHTVIGEMLCGNLRSLQAVRQIVRHHHERQDGSGYPDGLRGDDIPLLASVISVVDAYDAMTSVRPYKGAYSPEIACLELARDAGRGWKDQTIVDAFIDLQRSGAFVNMENQ